MSEAQQDRRLEIAMGHMLRIGVTLAALVVLAGGVLYLARTGGPAPDYSHFTAIANPDPLGSIVEGTAHLNSRSLIQLGILLLIATPVCRVLFGVVGFALLRDRFYVMVSAVVLAVLIYSLLGRR